MCFRHLLILLLIGGLLCPAWLPAQVRLPTAFRITGPNTEAISNYYQCIKDSTNQMQVKQVLQEFASGNGRQPNRGNMVFNSRYTRSTYWFAIQLQNGTTHTLPLLWSFYNNNLGFELYDVTDTARIRFAGRILSGQPLSLRQVAVRAPAYKIDLPAGASRLLLAKVYRLNAESIYFPSDISTTEDILLWEINFCGLIGCYIGYFLCVALFNLFLGLLLRARIHIWHCLYVVCIVLYALSENMLDVLLLPNWLYPVFNQLPKMLFLHFALLFGLMEVQLFTRQAATAPVWNKVFNGLKAVLLVVGAGLLAGSLVLPPQHTVLVALRIGTDLLFLAGTLIMVSYLVTASFRGNRRTLIYLLAAFLLLLGYLDFIMVTLFDWHFYRISHGNIIAGLGIEITLLTAIFIANISQERKRNFGLQQQQSRENQQLSGSLITVQEQERTRIAQDLHDGLGSDLSAMKLLVAGAAMDNKDELIALINKAYADVRTTAHNLLQNDLLTSGLYTALQKMEKRLNQQRATVYSFQLTGSDTSIPPDKALQLYRIISEATTNIAKHAAATKALVEVDAGSTEVLIVIEDNGVGLPPVPYHHKGMGLMNIKTRVAYMQGQMELRSTAAGTLFNIRVALEGKMSYE